MRASMLRLGKILACTVLAGIFSACGGGGGGTTTSSVPPPANVAPVARISASTGDGFAPLTVTFDATSSTDSDGTIASYAWDFGDGASASGATTSHVYAEPGSFTVSLRITDDDGVADIDNFNVRVRGVTLSGEVRILASSASDSDVNDRLTSVVPNNDFASAQPLPNPVQLGGFVNLPGTGPRDENGNVLTLGNLFASGDPADFYAVTLAGSELILLTVAEADADLDLALYDAQGNFLDASATLAATESLEVSAPGSYFIEVFPAAAATNPAGASNYVLSVGQNVSASSRGVSRVSDPFVAGEVLIETATDPEPVAASHGLTRRANAGRLALAQLADAPLAAAERRAARGAVADEVEPRARRNMSSEQRQKLETLLTLKRLARDPRVAHAEPNLLRVAHRTPNDSLYGLQWHYGAIQLPAAWDITTGTPPVGADDVIVAVIDTGVLLDHPDLEGQLVPGYDFISDPARARDGDGIDANPNDDGDLAFGATSSFHGTHVAGTVAANSNNAAGVAGVSWGAKIMPLRALGRDGGTSFDIIQAVRFAAGLANDSNTLPERPADIINLSLGSGFPSAIEQALYDEVRAAGILVVASAGNGSSAAPSFPAGYSGVMAVSATDINAQLAPYSNFGASIDVAAPGGYNLTDRNGDGIGDGVVSTLGDDSGSGVQFGYAALNGTSMAAPHVAGVAALMKAVHPGLTPAEFTSALLAGALTDDLGAPGRDDAFGYGQINAQKAVLEALTLASGAGVDPGPILAVSPGAVNFGLLLSDAEVTLSNLGSGSIVISDITSSVPWLSVAPVSIDADGLGRYALQIDRGGLADGPYAASVTFAPADPDTNNATIDVTMQVASASVDADAGLHYIILVDASGESAVAPVVLNVDGGRYPFRFADVPLGEYRIFAGSDMDDDSFLCDSGEACGAFRTLDAPEVLLVDPSVATDMSDLDFVSEFRAVITTLSGSAAGQRAEGPGGAGIRFPRPTTGAAND